MTDVSPTVFAVLVVQDHYVSHSIAIFFSLN